MRFILLLLSVFLLVGCFGTPGAGLRLPSLPSVPSDISMLEQMAAWGMIVGSLFFFVGVLVFFLLKRRLLGGQLVLAAISMAISSRLLAWFSQHIIAISLMCAAATILAGYLYYYKRHILEGWFGDLDGDGKIAQKPKE